ncbi:MAG: YdcF family protein [Flavobacteriales bacterium]|nr:YdcF family protein [Flavobacteriales bacterium]MBK8708943.1 YdcF family protein [Flavobacteriales bacterium]
MRDLLPTLGMLAGQVVRFARHGLRKLLFVFGIGALLLTALACTRIPFDAHRWLGSAGGECTRPVGRIIVLGGSGMPSGPELLRLHHAAELAKADTTVRITVIHPGDPKVIGAMVDELVLRGIAPSRITPLNEGDNTREQALAFWKHYPRNIPVALVTSPENMYRSVRAFQRANRSEGRVCGSPAWENAMDHDFNYQHQNIGGKTWAPDVSNDPGLRYTFWNYLKLEITCLREFVAIGYYALNDWI